MANPFRRARWVVGAVLLAGVAWVGWLLTRVERRPAVAIVERQRETTVAAKEAPPVTAEAEAVATPADEPAASELETTFFENFDGERFEQMRGLHAAQAYLQADGTLLLEQGVTIRLESGPGQPPVVVRSLRGRLPPDAGEGRIVELTGDVVVEGEGGFELRTDRLDVDQQRTLVTSRAPARFRKGEMHGTAGALEHDWAARRTLLTGGAEIVLTGADIDARRITISGQRLRHLDAERLVEVRGRGRIDLDGGRVSGEILDVHLDEAGREVERVDASGAAETLTAAVGVSLPGGDVSTRRLRAGRIVHRFGSENRLESIEAESTVVLSGSAVGGDGGAREQLRADRLRLIFAGDRSATLRRLEASGAPARLLTDGPAGRREVVGRNLEVDVRPSGSLERLAATGEAQVEEEAGGRSRVIRGDEVTLGFADEQPARLRELAFRGTPGRITERTAAGDQVEERVAVARAGEIRLGDGTEPAAGELTGGVELVSGEHRATGSAARLSDGGDRLLLDGPVGLELPGRSCYGEEAIYDRNARTLVVRGRQHTVVKDPSSTPGLENFVSGDEPVLISSEQVTFHLAEERAVYSAAEGQGGRPDVRQGDVALRADVITLQEGDVLAEGAVESKLRLSQPDGRPRPQGTELFDPTALITARSERFEHRRDLGIVRYEGGAELEQEGRRLQADAVEVGLVSGASSVESVRATGAAYYAGGDLAAEGEVIDFRQSEKLVLVEGGRRPARVRRGGQFATGGTLEVRLDEQGIRIRPPHGGRTRRVSTLASGLAGTGQ